MKINGLFKAATNNTNGKGLSSQQKFVSFVAAFAVLSQAIFNAEGAETAEHFSFLNDLSLRPLRPLR
jgi:hypothetical protein